MSTSVEEKEKIFGAAILNYKPPYSLMQSESVTAQAVLLIGSCIIDSFWHFLSRTQLSCSIFIIMLPAKLCTA